MLDSVCWFSFMVLALVNHLEILIFVLKILLHPARFNTAYSGSNTHLTLVTVGVMPLGIVTSVWPSMHKYS